MAIEGQRKHTLTALVQDRPGVLNRVVSLVRRRGINISSLAVGHSETPELSRLTFVIDGDDYSVEQATKQLYKLIDVVRVSEFAEDQVVARELALIKVRTTAASRSEVIEIVDIFRAKIVDVAPSSIIVEITGDEEKIDALMALLKPFGIREVMRSGRLAMQRGQEILAQREKSQASSNGPHASAPTDYEGA
ncbi:MAG: acetolactate synthase-1/3 small subunit [Chloroflexi bacterium]|jgi:acetolactate synthase-1/3 small subunit|nr:MAG: acetolactate synthase-1/3 small subunit [Chloroflexota bacterium]